MQYTTETIASHELPLFIDGQWRDPHSKQYFDSYNPATGEPWYRAAEANAADVDAAISAARNALRDPQWGELTQSVRGEHLFRLADLIGQHHQELAEIETRDNGKLIRETRAQIGFLRDYYRYFAGMADKLQGDTVPINKSAMLNMTLREPIGVIGIIVPWNSPLYMMSCTLAPCLAVGNTVVIKPSEHTSASAIAFAELIVEAGFPPGVVNIVTGAGASTGDALTRHSGIDKIAFTGGTETGRKVATNAAQNIVPCNLELGGKSPHVVFGDADLERAANGVVAGVFAAAGQTCVAGSRCFVEASIHDDLVALLQEKSSQIILGDPSAEETQIGPLALREQLEKVTRYVGYGVEDGAALIAGGKQPDNEKCAGGWYFEPTLFTDVDNSMRIARDEIFGPVAGIIKFQSEKELLALAN
ncbi:MAG: aldehyde dehydrogenase, partial [Pseudomonadota bacterium]